VKLRFHWVVVDGVFEADATGAAVFHPASTLDVPAIADVQSALRRRLLRSALRRGLLSAQHAQVLAEWEHGGGFPVDAKVRIEAASAMVWNVCCATAPAPPLRWNGCVKSTPSMWSMRTSSRGRVEVRLLSRTFPYALKWRARRIRRTCLPNRL